MINFRNLKIFFLGLAPSCSPHSPEKIHLPSRAPSTLEEKKVSLYKEEMKEELLGTVKEHQLSELFLKIQEPEIDVKEVIQEITGKNTSEKDPNP